MTHDAIRRLQRGLDVMNATLALACLGAIIACVSLPDPAPSHPAPIVLPAPTHTLPPVAHYAPIFEATLQPRERVVTPRPAPSPIRVDEELRWLGRAIRVTAVLPDAIECTVQAGERTRTGVVWFQGRSRTVDGRLVTLELADQRGGSAVLILDGARFVAGPRRIRRLTEAR